MKTRLRDLGETCNISPQLTKIYIQRYFGGDPKSNRHDAVAFTLAVRAKNRLNLRSMSSVSAIYDHFRRLGVGFISASISSGSQWLLIEPTTGAVTLVKNLNQQQLNRGHAAIGLESLIGDRLEIEKEGK